MLENFNIYILNITRLNIKLVEELLLKIQTITLTPTEFSFHNVAYYKGKKMEEREKGSGGGLNGNRSRGTSWTGSGYEMECLMCDVKCKVWEMYRHDVQL